MNIRLEGILREAVVASSDILVYCGACVRMLRETVGNFSRYRSTCQELSRHHISLLGDIQL